MGLGFKVQKGRCCWRMRSEKLDVEAPDPDPESLTIAAILKHKP